MTIDLYSTVPVPDPGSGHDWALSVHSIIRCVVVATVPGTVLHCGAHCDGREVDPSRRLAVWTDGGPLY